MAVINPSLVKLCADLPEIVIYVNTVFDQRVKDCHCKRISLIHTKEHLVYLAEH